jgi:hypothetical protein
MQKIDLVKDGSLTQGAKIAAGIFSASGADPCQWSKKRSRGARVFFAYH